jgi:ferredoxin/flavodoxin---NADP+ reductase
MSEDIQSATVAIIGAGPAGLFAAQELTRNGVKVVLFNRDIKPGGLAEYGVYPDKLKLKEGLRAQFDNIIGCSNAHYFGNVTIGENQPLGICDLQKLGFAAILVTCGAQGTKWLGLPGEDSLGVYHAKEVVYHYNHLPPFSTRNYEIGKRVVVVGVGNVMADIVRYLTTLPQVEEITTIARRGLAEVKFEKKELGPIIGHLDMQDFQNEVERISAAMKFVEQDPEDETGMLRAAYESADEKNLKPVWRLHFLYSPAKIRANEAHEVTGIQLELNNLELQNGEIKAKGTGNFIEQDTDTVIFAIGDRVNNDLGLPLQGFEFAKNPAPRFPVNGNSYEINNGAVPKVGGEVFVGGWSRNASSGLVGLTRKDGSSAAQAILAYLHTLPVLNPVPVETIEAELTQKGYRYVTPTALSLLETAEKKQAAQRGLPEFKYDTNEEMLKAMKID